MKLSVVVPVYNEVAHIEASLSRLFAAPIPMALQVVVVENGSTDGSLQRIHALLPSLAPRGLELLDLGRPVGKGAAVRAGMERCTGDWFAVHDADLEYDPDDLPALLAPLVQNRCDLANGTRIGREDSHFLFDLHRLFNRSLTTFVNLSFAAHITDLTSCYKVAALATYRALGLVSTGFALETEILSKAFQQHLRVREVPIRYQARTYEQGKKIRPLDALPIVWTAARVRLTGR